MAYECKRLIDCAIEGLQIRRYCSWYDYYLVISDNRISKSHWVAYFRSFKIQIRLYHFWWKSWCSLLLWLTDIIAFDSVACCNYRNSNKFHFHVLLPLWPDLRQAFFLMINLQFSVLNYISGKFTLSSWFYIDISYCPKSPHRGVTWDTTCIWFYM